ncbi:PQQ-dependent dehydrogenase, methanol/ethanol family [Marinobacterium stanieri]|uniref:PQQ-dependent dehydrogenase, methanol/ethanol family n=1 Tax=Marinobacterium stanieri TaxID=49186 RepID=UPI0002558F30|nr:PQQ-dependent dehydrogenase, methanol/ethanol family [Marinobacterium stanieri]
MRRLTSVLPTLPLLAALAAAPLSSAVAAVVTAERLNQAAEDTSNWMSHGRDYSEQRFSPLDQINSENAYRLGLDWYHEFDSKRGLEATPLVIDGVLYTTGTWNRVYAFDAETGKELWSFDPQVNREIGIKLCCDAVNRGLAAWGDKLYMGTLDGRLIAIDSKTGEDVWTVQTTDPDKAYSITGAPRVIKGKVMIGNGGAEFGVRGYFSAYDAETGDQLWRFYTVPGNPAEETDPLMKEISSTWSGEWWKLGGGGTAWDSMAYDPELDLLYVGVGNGSPWNREIRSNGEGDNLFLSSIVAVRPDTGEYVWHYQTTPGEEWDYTATQHMILADLELDGEARKVIMQAPKNGNFYVLDRETGEFINADNYVDINWMSGFDENGRPQVVPEARYATSGKPWVGSPGFLGGHSWQPMSFNPETGLVYFPTRQMNFPYIPDANFEIGDKKVNLGTDMHAAAMPQDPAIKAAVKAATKGRLVAWDPIQQKEVWGVDKPVPWNGGTLSTSGDLVFQGDGQGYFKAFDARTGEEKWSWFAQTGIVAAPISYNVDDRQYIAVMAGWGGALPLLTGDLSAESTAGQTNRLLVFSLDGEQKLPEFKQINKPLNPPADTADAETVAQGKLIYQNYCASCHGDTAVSGGVLPDLRYASGWTFDNWNSILIDGLYKNKGMVSFGDVLKPEQAQAVKSYIIHRANQTLDELKKQEEGDK